MNMRVRALPLSFHSDEFMLDHHSRGNMLYLKTTHCVHMC